MERGRSRDLTSNRAINCMPGKLPSAVTSARFDLKVSPPTFEPASGEFYGEEEGRMRRGSLGRTEKGSRNRGRS